MSSQAIVSLRNLLQGLTGVSGTWFQSVSLIRRCFLCVLLVSACFSALNLSTLKFLLDLVHCFSIFRAPHRSPQIAYI